MKKISFGASRPTSGATSNTGDIDAWVIDRTINPPREPTKRLTIDVPVSLHRRIKTTCAVENLIIADVVRGLLERRFAEPKGTGNVKTHAAVHAEGEGARVEINPGNQVQGAS